MLEYSFLFSVRRRHTRGALVTGVLTCALPISAWRAHQILAATPANRLQVLLADDAPVKHPDAPRISVFALHHAQNRLHRGNIGAVAVEGLVDERKALAVRSEEGRGGKGGVSPRRTRGSPDLYKKQRK